jgi:hypothetical protein
MAEGIRFKVGDVVAEKKMSQLGALGIAVLGSGGPKFWDSDTAGPRSDGDAIALDQRYNGSGKPTTKMQHNESMHKVSGDTSSLHLPT